MLSPWRCLFYGTQWRTCPSLNFCDTTSRIHLLFLESRVKERIKISEHLFWVLCAKESSVTPGSSSNKSADLACTNESDQQGCAEASRVSPALITLYVHTGVSLEDAIGSCSMTQTAATVSVWVAMEKWWFISLAVHNINRQINESPRSYLRSIMKMNETLHCVSCDWFVPGFVIFSPSSLRFRFASSL